MGNSQKTQGTFLKQIESQFGNSLKKTLVFNFKLKEFFLAIVSVLNINFPLFWAWNKWLSYFREISFFDPITTLYLDSCERNGKIKRKDPHNVYTILLYYFTSTVKEEAKESPIATASRDMYTMEVYVHRQIYNVMCEPKTSMAKS